MMMDEQKFECFKRDAVRKSEAEYGRESREKYGDDAVDASNRRLLSLSPAEYAEWQRLDEEIRARLAEAVREKQRPDGPVGADIAELHRRWLSYTWTRYSPQAHAGLAEMYIADERFRSYYDAEVPGCAQFLRDAVVAMTSRAE